MTYHSSIDYKCHECDEPYIPFSEEQRPCPKCEHPADEVMDVVPRMVRGARENLRWGCFMTCSIGDHYIMYAMNTIGTMRRFGLEAIEDNTKLGELCDAFLGLSDFSGFEHRRPHIKAFVKAVIEEEYGLNSPSAPQ